METEAQSIAFLNRVSHRDLIRNIVLSLCTTLHCPSLGKLYKYKDTFAPGITDINWNG